MSLFQPRGPVILRELNTALALAAAGFQICPDAISVSPKVDTWTHINKCGLSDAEDARGVNGVHCDGTMTFATRADKDRALAFLGTVNAAAVGTSAVVNEALLGGAIGGIEFLGGKERHRVITACTIHGDGSPTGPLLTADTDYTLDPTTGRVTWLTAQTNGCTTSYTHQDPAAVSMLTATSKEYALDMEAYNRQANNQKCSLELYRVRFDPTSTADFMPANQQDLTMAFSCLIDTTRAVDDTEFGQFGRLVNIE